MTRKAPAEGSPQLERQREWHGWAFRNYDEKQCVAICHYIETGKVTEDLPRRSWLKTRPFSSQVTTDHRGVEWVIKNRDEVVLCRSPKRYKNRDDAIQALELFYQTMERT